MKPDIQTILPGFLFPSPDTITDSTPIPGSDGTEARPVRSEGIIHDEKYPLQIGNELIEYQVKRSRRAKQMRIRVNQWGEIEVVIPFDADIRAAKRFVQANTAWIARQTGKYHPHNHDTKRWIEKDGRTIPYTISINKRAKRIILKILPDKSVILVIPPGMNADKAHDFVVGKTDWIFRRLDDETRPFAPFRQYHDGEKFLVLGREVSLSIAKDMPFFDIRLEDKQLVIHIPTGIPDSVLLHYTRKNIELFLEKTLQEISSNLIRLWADRLGVSVPKITYKNQKSRWGVCSTNGIILNIRLAMAPLDLIEYVVVHELCHIIQPNHSRAFWGLVAQMLPDYRERLHRLKCEGRLFCL